MRPHDILAATASAQGTDIYPYYLSLLAIVISLIAIFRASAPAAGKTQPKAAAPPARPQEARTPQAVPASHAVPPEIVAVIAAAVATVTGSSHRIVSIKPMSTSWERAGRQSVLTSHRIR
jgi:glutaconyl-CoA decarboxylase